MTVHLPFRDRVAGWGGLMVSSFGLIDVVRIEPSDRRLGRTAARDERCDGS